MIQDETANDLTHLAEHVGELAVSAVEPVAITPGVHLTALTPPGWSRATIDAESMLAEPRRKTGTVTLDETASLVAFIERHGELETVVYVDFASATLVAVVNDWPGWRDHRAVMRLQATPGWRRWSDAHGKMLAQDAFAELVEDGITEIAEPAGADLLELAQSIQATTKANFRSDRRLANGQVQLAYHEEVDARAGADGQMVIPARITLVLAPFFGSEKVTLTARLRYRVRDGKLSLGVVLDRIEDTLRDAIAAEVDRLPADVGVLWGRP